MNQAPLADSVAGLLVGVGLLVIPVAVGASLRGMSGPKLTIAIFASAALAVGFGVRVGDALWVGALVELGALGAPLVGAQLGAAWVLVEVLGRLALAPGPSFVDDPASVLVWDAPYAAHRERACELIFPQEQRTTNPTVLHLGDSLLVSIPTRDDAQRMPELLHQLDPTRDHLNLGVQRSSLDVHARIATTWMELTATEQVVVWVFLNNDLDELGVVLPCCPPADRPDGWCQEPLPGADDPRQTRLRRRAWLPTAVRVWANWSRVGGQLRGRVSAIISGADHPPMTHDQARQRYEATLTFLAERCAEAGAALTVAHMPMRDQHVSRYRDDLRWIAELTDRLDLKYVDFTAQEWDPADFSADGWHLTQRGHAELARRAHDQIRHR